MRSFCAIAVSLLAFRTSYHAVAVRHRAGSGLGPWQATLDIDRHVQEPDDGHGQRVLVSGYNQIAWAHAHDSQLCLPRLCRVGIRRGAPWSITHDLHRTQCDVAPPTLNRVAAMRTQFFDGEIRPGEIDAPAERS